MNLNRITWIVFALGVLALAVGPVVVEQRGTRSLAAVAGAGRALGDGPYVSPGVYPSTNMSEVPQGIVTRGSWLESDAYQGVHDTSWFAAQPKITVLIAGYPTHPGNRLEIELRHGDGALSRIPFTGENPRETWQPWLVVLPPQVEALRIRAVDGLSDPGGWLGFSEPFVVVPQPGAQAWAIFQLLTATCLAMTLIYGPGLVWFQSRADTPHLLAHAILIGPLLLVALGGICWVLGGWIAPATLARIGVAALLARLGWRGWRVRRSWRLPREVSAIVGAGALLVGFAVAKASYSGGPAGELFQHTIGRTLAVGGHSDSRIPYQVAQLVANHFAPFGNDAEFYFWPWSFGSRGPLASLAVAPVMLATGAQPSRGLPDNAWQPFDREGFATYRITMIVLASLAAWAVFGVVAQFASAAWGLIGAAIVMLAPFFIHELYFTWPKLIAAALVLAAFLLAHQRRAFVAGVIIGVGYLFHPLAVLSAPFIALWLFARADGARWWDRFGPPLWCAAGALVLVVPWQLIGRWHPGEGATAQAVFLTYFRLADNAAATWPTWWQSRWDNFAHTFLPGYLLTADPAHESLNAVQEPSDAWVRRSYLYWNTLPFALGVPGFLLVAAAIGSALRRAPATVFATFVGPALLLITYWGAASTGLMRHCGHALFLSAIALATWSLARWGTAWRERAITAFLHPACFAWRALEVGVVAFGTTLLKHRPDLETFFGWNDILTLCLATGCLAGATLVLAKTAVAIRPALFAPSETTSARHK